MVAHLRVAFLWFLGKKAFSGKALGISLNLINGRLLLLLRATVGGTPDFKNNYTYDKLRRLTDVVQTGQVGGNSVVSKHIAQSFNASSQRTNITRYQSAGTTNLVASTIFTYDTVGRLSGIGHTQGATNLNTYAYTYDPLSRLSSVTSTAEGTTNYSYFNDSQLKSASGSQPTESYTYDTNGNRTMAGYTTIADNRTTADANFTYTYDAEGNLTRKTNKSTLQVVATYEWDHRNRLSKVNGGVTGPGGIEYEYDAFNRLVRRRAFDPNVPNQYWVYDEGINPVLQFDTGGNAGVGGVSHRYIWSDYVDDLLSDEQISFPSNTVNTLWPLADHLGSIRDIADFNEATGITAIANHRTYDSFGKLVDETGTASIPFGYTGKLVDKSTGLQNNLNRWYDPNLGKWISQDPIGFAGGDANLYRYVGNRPTNASDPSGLAGDWAWEWHHLLPKEIFEGMNIRGVDINSKKYGFMMRMVDHRGAGDSIHSLGWNNVWQEWVIEQADNGKAITKRSINRQLKKMMNEFDMANRGFKAKFGYDAAERAYQAAERMWRAGRPVASRAVSKLAEEAGDSVKVPRLKGKVPGRVAGGILGSLFGSWALGGDPVNDSIDGFILTSPMGYSDPDWDMFDYGPWDDYQRELDAMQEAREDYDDYINNSPSPPDDYYGPFAPHEGF